MKLTYISETLALSPQIEVADIAELKELGFRTIICNRPDEESPDQTSFEVIDAEAHRFGISTVHVPVQSGAITEADVLAHAEALRGAHAPILAYCRSGTRSAHLWALIEAKTRAADDVLDDVQSAGFSVSGLAEKISAS